MSLSEPISNELALRHMVLNELMRLRKSYPREERKIAALERLLAVYEQTANGET